MSPRGDNLGRRLAALLEDLRDHERQHPAEVEAIAIHLVAHLRSWKPESVTPLGVLGPPTEAIRDPRR